MLGKLRQGEYKFKASLGLWLCLKKKKKKWSALLRKHLVTILQVFVIQELDTLEEPPESRTNQGEEKKQLGRPPCEAGRGLRAHLPSDKITDVWRWGSSL